jgi:uncharacterized protein YprB with RNaseH-like and TPR domain
LRSDRLRRVEPASADDRRLPGVEIESGLMLFEARCDWQQRPAWIDAAFAKMPGYSAERFRFFDTETTGLAGGAGTRAFQIGMAQWVDHSLLLRQLTMTRLAAESAMLRTFSGWLTPDVVLVSYNGKSYDSPLLTTRYRLSRLPDPLHGLPHLDLLYPTRRHYRGVWENCRLATIERHLLGVVREDDLPGSEAPRAWLEYLRGGSARDLRRVMHHNAQDLRSLALLVVKLAEVQSLL